MIHANELRLGNLVLGITGEVETVCGIYEKNVRTRQGDSKRVYSAEYADVEPIPITEDWLVKMGFDPINGIKHPDAPIYFCYHIGKWTFFIYDFSHGYVMSVHQIQNHYFLLTGQELKITL